MPETQTAIHILMLNSTPRNVFGGVEQWMVCASAGLIARGHSVHAIGRSRSRFISRMYEIEVPAYSKHSGINYGPFSALRIAGIARRHEVDVAIVNYNKELTQVAVAQRISPIQKIVSRSILPMVDTDPRHRNLYEKHLDGMITPSGDVKRTVESYPWMTDVQVESIPNGLDLNRVDRASDQGYEREVVLKQLGLSPDLYVIGAVGRLENHKGFHHLIAAFDKLSQWSQDIALIIVGDGSQASALKEQAAGLRNITSKVHFIGYLSDVDPLITAFDVIVLPSTTKYETFGQVLIEAMAFSIPVIGSDVGGIPEIINHEENGLLVKPGDEAGLAQAILRLEMDIELRLRLAYAGRQTVEWYFQEEMMVDRLETYLTKLLRTP